MAKPGPFYTGLPVKWIIKARYGQPGESMLFSGTTRGGSGILCPMNGGGSRDFGPSLVRFEFHRVKNTKVQLTTNNWHETLGNWNLQLTRSKLIFLSGRFVVNFTLDNSNSQ